MCHPVFEALKLRISYPLSTVTAKRLLSHLRSRPSLSSEWRGRLLAPRAAVGRQMPPRSRQDVPGKCPPLPGKGLRLRGQDLPQRGLLGTAGRRGGLSPELHIGRPVPVQGESGIVLEYDSLSLSPSLRVTG